MRTRIYQRRTSSTIIFQTKTRNSFSKKVLKRRSELFLRMRLTCRKVSSKARPPNDLVNQSSPGSLASLSKLNTSSRSDKLTILISVSHRLSNPTAISNNSRSSSPARTKARNQRMLLLKGPKMIQIVKRRSKACSSLKSTATKASR